MYKTSLTTTLSKCQHWFLRMCIVLGFVCLSILATTIGTTMTSYASSRPGGNVTDPVVRAVDIAEPAVGRIFTSLGGHLTVHFSATSSVTFPQHPVRGTGNTGNSYPLQLSGSGTFISAHGDI